MTSGLKAIVAAELAKPYPAAIGTMAAALLGRHGNVLAVLAYGSSLRGVDPRETLIDLYLLTERVDDVSANPLARWGCRLAPPNVLYAEAVENGRTLRAKYALLSLDAFERRCGAATSNPYFWARFAQPSRLVHARDEEVRRRVVKTCAEAVRTMVGEGSRLVDPEAEPLALWEAVLAQTYRTELRPEGKDKAREIAEANEAYYRAVTDAAMHGPPMRLRRSSWPVRQAEGKALSVLRLLKAAFTFQGGADYLAWKISRHSGAEIEIKPWQRRHPILGALSLLPSLLRKGAVR